MHIRDCTFETKKYLLAVTSKLRNESKLVEDNLLIGLGDDREILTEEELYCVSNSFISALELPPSLSVIVALMLMINVLDVDDKCSDIYLSSR